MTDAQPGEMVGEEKDRAVDYWSLHLEINTVESKIGAEFRL